MKEGDLKKKLVTSAWHLQLGQYELARALLLSVGDDSAAEDSRAKVLHLFCDLALWGTTRNGPTGTTPHPWAWDPALQVSFSPSLPSVHHLRLLAWGDYMTLAATSGLPAAELPIPIACGTPERLYLDYVRFCVAVKNLAVLGNEFDEVLEGLIENYHGRYIRASGVAYVPAGEVNGVGMVPVESSGLLSTADGDEDSESSEGVGFSLDTGNLASTSLRRTSTLGKLKMSDFGDLRSGTDVAELLCAIFKNGGKQHQADGDTRINKHLVFEVLMRYTELGDSFDVFFSF